ncbi:probable E3 ubiquitin-protein ligase RHB1A [Beta vulgaris subsp. vulgaris]|uniref:probable E3 ubiquitin-protein ligase RHB1A n=1 Tax=Beta vulgaris subsp. vulgaris TaxID=3555 RepID=UPI002036CB48|nr:probable E3 ubiquitin-protein ligase RHB1A [Beta vulgaris subsp. vulgaris]
MGGCCCSSRKSQLQGTPVYYYCPPSLEEQENLRAYRGTASGLSTGLLVGLNLDTSSPDTFRPPPAPIPFNVLFGRPQTPIHTHGSQGQKCDTVKHSKPAAIGDGTDCIDKLISGNHVGKSEGKTLADILLASPTKSDVEITKSSETYGLVADEEDACPICLEEYDADNPKMVTSCEHDFHLSCLLEWMERSDACPVCDKEMIFDQPDDQN